MKKIRKILLVIVLAFLIINIILVILWPIKIHLKFSNYEPYSKEALNSLNLSKSDSLKLYLETWQRTRLYEYDEFTGLTESESENFQFVNISKDKGRKINNNTNCSNNIFFYGGETMFGYDVTDTQTIPFYFKNELDNLIKKNKYCVYNFGRSTYFSTQENILFYKHLLKNKINKNDIIIFLDGMNEKGNQKILNTDFIEKFYNALHQKYWNLYKESFKIFFSALPSSQAFLLIKKKILPEIKKKKLEKNSNQIHDDIFDVYQTNVNFRKIICQSYEINCYSFLQPFAGIHGKYLEDGSKKRSIEVGSIKVIKEKNQKKYLILKKADNIFDISQTLNDSEVISYVSGNHYTPESNRIISKEIFNIVVEKIIK